MSPDVIITISITDGQKHTGVDSPGSEAASLADDIPPPVDVEEPDVVPAPPESEDETHVLGAGPIEPPEI